MSRRSPSFHMEHADLKRLRGCWSLSEVIVLGPQDREGWEELLERIDQSKEELGLDTSARAVRMWIALLAAGVRMGEVGFRGYVGTYAVACETLERVIDGGKMGKTTLRNVCRICEHADIGYRDLGDRSGKAGKGRGRGKGRAYIDRDGAKRYARRNVLMFTLSEWLIGLIPERRLDELRRERPEPIWYVSESDRIPSGSNNSPPNPPIPSESPGSTGSPDARDRSFERSGGSETSSSEELELSSRVWTRPRGSPSRASPAREPPETSEHPRGQPGREPQGRRRLSPPVRRYGYRPLPRDPDTYQNARRALLYDLETALLRQGETSVETILVRAELETAVHHLGAHSYPWPEIVWHWRGLPLDRRRALLRRGVLPALRAALRRDWLRTWPPDPRVAPRRVTPRQPGELSPGIAGRRVEPGPRLREIEIAEEPALTRANRSALSRPERFTDAYRRHLADRSIDELEHCRAPFSAKARAWLRKKLE